MQTGAITKETLLEFVKSMGGFAVVVFTIAVSLASRGFFMYSSKFLQEWSQDFDNPNKYDMLKKYTVYCLISAVLMSVLSAITAMIGYKLAVNMHSNMIFAILHSKLQEFLDRIPIGRVINKFSSDIDTVDKRIYFDFSWYLRDNCYGIVLFVTMYWVLGIEILLLIVIWLYFAINWQNIS